MLLSDITIYGERTEKMLFDPVIGLYATDMVWVELTRNEHAPVMYSSITRQNEQPTYIKQTCDGYRR